jgi:AcrR family transcriptional regulator
MHPIHTLPGLKSEASKGDEETKKRIMEGARALFFRFGFSKVTMDEAAENLGMSKKTLYRFFPSKEDLLEEITRTHMAECDAHLSAICEEKDVDPLDKLKNYMNYVATLFAMMSDALLYDLRRNAPEIWKMIEEHRQQCLQGGFCTLIKEGRHKGRFRKDVDEKLFVLIYATVVKDILNPEVLSGLPFKPNQVFDTLVKVLFEGLLTDKARVDYHAK